MDFQSVGQTTDWKSVVPLGGHSPFCLVNERTKSGTKPPPKPSKRSLNCWIQNRLKAKETHRNRLHVMLNYGGFLSGAVPTACKTIIADHSIVFERFFI